MCRLFAYKTKNPQATNEILIKSLEEFRMLAENGCVPCGIPKGHYDGWGIVAYKNGAVVLYVRSNDRANTDLKFTSAVELLCEYQPDIVIAHLRKTTRGGNSFENTQPFVSNNLSFCHNGTLYIEESELNGKSDSLYVFNDISKNYISSETFISIYKKYQSEYNYTAMNMLFSDGDTLTVARGWNENNPKKDEQKLEEYYTLYRTVFSECSYFCSEKLKNLDRGEITLLDNQSITTV